MALPQASDIQTSHYDAGVDNPRLARAQLKTLLDKTRDLINAIDTAGGLAKLDADGKAKLDDLFATDPTLRMAEIYSGVVRQLAHREYRVPQGWLGGELPPYEVKAADSFRMISRDLHGHAISVDVGAAIPRIHSSLIRATFLPTPAAAITGLLYVGNRLTLIGWRTIFAQARGAAGDLLIYYRWLSPL